MLVADLNDLSEVVVFHYLASGVARVYHDYRTWTVSRLL